MKFKQVVLNPDPRLRAPNTEVTEPWEKLEPLVRQMWKVMYNTGNGVGLAAPQVGWNARLFIMNPDTESKKPDAQRVFWNPLIVEVIGVPVKVREGCLSLPGVFGTVMRYPAVRLRAMSPKGPVEETFMDFPAQIVQHEVGHLNGELVWEHFIKEPTV